MHPIGPMFIPIFYSPLLYVTNGHGYLVGGYSIYMFVHAIVHLSFFIYRRVCTYLYRHVSPYGDHSIW